MHLDTPHVLRVGDAADLQVAIALFFYSILKHNENPLAGPSLC